MAPNKGVSRAREFEDLAEGGPTEFDPEADNASAGASDSEAESQTGEDEDHGRGHYVDVGKSKLRKAKATPLGPQYRGSKVSRDAMEEDEEEDDPFDKGFDEEASSDEEGGVEVDSEDAGELTHGTSEDDSADEAEDEMAAGMKEPKVDRAELRKTFAEDQKAMASSISQSAKADADKGRAVKRQRTAFDALLNGRIKLQKSLVEANTLVGLPEDELHIQIKENTDAISSAEKAAYNLWSSLNDFREGLDGAKSGEKRKRAAFSIRTPTAELWKQTQAQEAKAQPHRNAVLQKWSVKTRGATATPQRSLLGDSESQTTAVDIIREHLSNTDRLMKRAHTPRSCAPLQLAAKVGDDPKIYDDADYYGLLLKELLEQKSKDSVAAANVDLDFNIRRETRTKKNVDTKASKGRKLRYTVHEKLQNFMAPEERGNWGERQTDELFGSLFGRKLALGEDEGQDDEAADGQDEIYPNEAGMMLFRR